MRAVVYLNRACPRACPYCNAKTVDTNRLSIDKMKQALTILKEKVGVDFFLFLGDEPLLLGQGLIELVQFLYEHDFYYGMYSTSPQPYFDKYKYGLAKAGLRSWSAGVDYIPEAVGIITPLARNLIDSSPQLIQKASDSLNGLEFMYKNGVPEIFTLITVSRMNVEFIPSMVDYVRDKYMEDERWKISFNYVEYKHNPDDDFSIPRAQNPDYFFTWKDKEVWQEFINKIKDYPFTVPLVPYLSDWYHAVNLNYKFPLSSEGWSMDSDGTLRKCGYCTGNHINKYTVFDLDDAKKLSYIETLRAKDISECQGCFWSLPWSVEHKGSDVLDFRTEFWKGRYRSVKVIEK